MRLKKQQPLGRAAGILLPVSSLPAPYGIGTLGAPAHRFVDFLKSAGQRYWQVLPIGPTSYGDSPYQSFSAFAGNPYFIDLNQLINEKLLTIEDVTAHDWGGDSSQADYAALYENRFAVLREAFSNSHHRGTKEYRDFCRENDNWLSDYALFMALKEYFGGRSWQEWPDEELRARSVKSIAYWAERLAEDVEFWKFCQFKFYEQWFRLRAYAAQNGVSIIGDIPIYVSLDSADVWAHPELFQLDDQQHPAAVAGVPPDMFSATGQLWGNPLYDWERMEQEDFKWWRERMAFSATIYDVIRIDHFIGIVRYYSVPSGETTAQNGKWRTGPGEKLVAAISEAVGSKRIIAEDLGLAVPAVIRLRDRAGYPGMKLLSLAFDSGPSNGNLPHHYHNNCVVYGGTHDNETLAGYCLSIGGTELAYAEDYLRVKRRSSLPWAIIRAAYASVADTAVFQMQDFLELDNRARMNTPSTLGGNWTWRMEGRQISGELANKIYSLAKLYGRVREQEDQDESI